MSDDHQVPAITEPLDEVSGRALVEAWRISGLSGAAYCRLHGLRAQRLLYWRERLGYPIKVVGNDRRSPVSPGPAPSAGSSSAGFVQVVVRAPEMLRTTYVDIVVGVSVIRIRPGFDAALVRQVIEALGGEDRSSSC